MWERSNEQSRRGNRVSGFIQAAIRPTSCNAIGYQPGVWGGHITAPLYGLTEKFPRIGEDFFVEVNMCFYGSQDSHQKGEEAGKLVSATEVRKTLDSN